MGHFWSHRLRAQPYFSILAQSQEFRFTDCNNLFSYNTIVRRPRRPFNVRQPYAINSSASPAQIQSTEADNRVPFRK